MKQILAQKSETVLQQLLRRHLGEETKVYLFGSRARGEGRLDSDFDLLIDGDVPRASLSLLREAIEESCVPYRVDLWLKGELSGGFLKEIEADFQRWI